jgi:glyceraldehyde-3-phosphate dehydrogenase/erythrose-4-phosphate dehydrogenase
MSDTTTVQIVEEVTQLSVSNANDISVTLSDDSTTLTVNNFALPTAYVDAVDVTFDAHGTVTANNVRDAIQHLADQQFRGTTAPTSDTANLEEGDLFYDTDDNQIKVYRETSSGVFEFVPIIVGDASGDSDTLDAGAF